MSVQVLIEELDEDEAMAMAQFVKRVGWSEMRTNAASEDETYLMRSALESCEMRSARPGSLRAKRQI